jgi:hypothetical protein
MFNPLATAAFRLAGRPAFRIHGRGRREQAWRVIDVFATRRRDPDSRWPAFLFRGTCITWTASVIAVGWDFAEAVLREQMAEPASREHPVEVAGGRLHDLARRPAAGALPWADASEVLAHEVGHTWQARRLGWLYWPTGAAFTLWREGPRWYNHFENQASEEGLFGGLVNGSVSPELLARVRGGESRG